MRPSWWRRSRRTTPQAAPPHRLEPRLADAQVYASVVMSNVEGMAGAGAGPLATLGTPPGAVPGSASLRKQLYASTLSKLRQLMIQRMAKPEVRSRPLACVGAVVGRAWRCCGMSKCVLWQLLQPCYPDPGLLAALTPVCLLPW